MTEGILDGAKLGTVLGAYDGCNVDGIMVGVTLITKEIPHNKQHDAIVNILMITWDIQQRLSPSGYDYYYNQQYIRYL